MLQGTHPRVVLDQVELNQAPTGGVLAVRGAPARMILGGRLLVRIVAHISGLRVERTLMAQPIRTKMRRCAEPGTNKSPARATTVGRQAKASLDHRMFFCARSKNGANTDNKAIRPLSMIGP